MNALGFLTGPTAVPASAAAAANSVAANAANHPLSAVLQAHQAALAEGEKEQAQNKLARDQGQGQGQGAGRRPGSLAAALEPPKFGFERFAEEQLALAGGRKLSGSDNKSGAVYTSGPLKGMTKGQAWEKLRQNYAAMPDGQRASYEASANLRDVTSAREDASLASHRAAKERAYGLGGGGGSNSNSGSGANGGSSSNSRSGGLRGGFSDSVSGVQGASSKGGSGLDYLRPRDEVRRRDQAGRTSSTPLVSVRSPLPLANAPSPASAGGNVLRSPYQPPRLKNGAPVGGFDAPSPSPASAPKASVQGGAADPFANPAGAKRQLQTRAKKNRAGIAAARPSVMRLGAGNRGGGQKLAALIDR